MKNFAMKKKDSKTFILNYKVEENQIRMHLASKETYVIPYTVENEKNVLGRMKQQVLNADAFENKQKKKFSDAIVNLLVALFLIGIATYVLIFRKQNIPIFIPIVVISFGGLMVLAAVIAMKKSKKKIKDIYKNRMFIAHEKKLNENIKSNQNILYHTSSRTKEVVSSMLLKHQAAFTFNTVDKMKYKELKQILENIERAEQFGFDFVSEKKEVVQENSIKKNQPKKKKERKNI